MRSKSADVLKPVSRSAREKQEILTKLAYKKVFGTQDGHLVLLDLMRSVNIFTSTYSPQAAEPVHEMLLAEGARTLVNRVLTEIDMDLEEFLKCFEETEEIGVYEDEK